MISSENMLMSAGLEGLSFDLYVFLTFIGFQNFYGGVSHP